MSPAQCVNEYETTSSNQTDFIKDQTSFSDVSQWNAADWRSLGHRRDPHTVNVWLNSCHVSARRLFKLTRACRCICVASKLHNQSFISKIITGCHSRAMKSHSSTWQVYHGIMSAGSFTAFIFKQQAVYTTPYALSSKLQYIPHKITRMCSELV